MTSDIPQLLEISTNEWVDAVTFTANGKLLVGGSFGRVRVWRVADGEQVAAMPTTHTGVVSVAASNDGRWIAGGTWFGGIFVWDATTYEQVFVQEAKFAIFRDVDFSPDSTRLVSANDDQNTATIWDFAAHQKVRTLDHDKPVVAAKYSARGDRIATAGYSTVWVWDSNDGRLLVDVEPWGSALLWCNNHLFVTSNMTILKKIDAATGSTVSERPIPDVFQMFGACLALPLHGQFIACSTEKTITFWDTTTHSQLGCIQHSDDIRLIAWASGGGNLAIVSGGKITIKSLLQSVLVPELDIDSTALDAWKRGQFADAEALLSAAIPASENRHHVFANRALVRARLGHWDAALVDAEQSIEIHPSIVGTIAKCVALVGKREKDEGIRVCDISFSHSHSGHVTLYRLIKAILLFMVGEHVNAMSCMEDLIPDTWMNSPLHTVQAYMHLLLGKTYLESGDHERAIQSFDIARIELGNCICQPPLVISLISGWEFDGLAITVQQCLCEALFSANRINEAAESVSRMVDRGINTTESSKKWVSDFKYRCHRKLEDLGNSALNDKRYDEAVSQYTAVLSLDPASPQDLLVKRSKAYAETGRWERALNDAYEATQLDSSSPLGYERKYAALLGIGRHRDAIDVFETMLSKMSESSDPDVRVRCRRYVRPEQTLEAIRTSIQNTIHELPLVLINTLSGRLCKKSEQAAAFESTPAFVTLIMSMTTPINRALIDRAIEEFYRYATFSHTWEGDEPLYEEVIQIAVYDLEASPTREKLRMFCKIVRDEGYNWAWSDTCCIDQKDPTVLQESLVSMFRWYKGSVMTIIFLYDVDGLAELGALIMSKWNSRGWTLQEYHASKVVRIYTKDWTPYLGLTLYNHKESPEVISEMEQATGMSAKALKALRPGLNDIRGKLRLASVRRTTRVEDAAYSLLGIFSMTIRASYGEGDKALGRLLAELLTSSGDTSILAWTGRPSSFNSCLPSNIVVFGQPLNSHIPPSIPDSETATIIAGLGVSAQDLGLVTRLYDKVDGLPTPTFAAQRMRLPCLAFKVRTISSFDNGSEMVFRARASALGVVEIKSVQNLAELDSLYLVHPWIDFLLDRHAVGTAEEDESSDLDEFFDASSDISSAFDADPMYSLPFPAVPPMDARMHFLARLRQPFGALLLAPTRRNMAEYKRIATECLITVQVQETTVATLNSLIHGVRVVDVL